MSETASTLIKAALRGIGAIDPGETPTAAELDNGLEALKMMLRRWSADDLNIYFITLESFTLTGAAYYTIGTGGTFNTTRPLSIRSAYIDSKDTGELSLLSESEYLNNNSGLWYSPEYPLGKIYIYPISTGTLYLSSFKELSEPADINADVSFPVAYDEAIKYGLMVRLAPEYGRTVTTEMVAIGSAALNDIKTRNFSSQINTVRPDILTVGSAYRIDEG